MRLSSLRKKRIKQKKCRRYQNANSDKLYLTIADGDFKIAKPIIKSVQKIVKTGNVAYIYEQEKLAVAIRKWYLQEFEVNFNNQQILFANGVLYWIHVAINAFSQKNDHILIFSPVYKPFGRTIKRMQRQVLDCPLIYQNHHWSINWNDLTKKITRAKLIVFCSPHNPTGNVWSKETLIKIATLAKENNCVLLVDEIWQDIILQKPFTHSLNLGQELPIIHIGGIGKTFNLGGLQYGHMISLNDSLFKKMHAQHLATTTYTSTHPWVGAALKSAYTNINCLKWKNQYVQIIKNNVQQLCAFLQTKNWEFACPEGTFMFLIKLGNNHLYGQALVDKMYALGVKVQSGEDFGSAYKYWVRINIAIDHQSILKLINVLQKYFGIQDLSK